MPVESGVTTGLLGSRVTALAAANAKHVVTADGEQGVLRLWRAATPWRDPVPLGRHGGRVTGMVEVEGRLVTTGADHRVLAWDLNGLGLTHRLLGTHDAGVTCVVALPDGWVVTGGHDGRLMVWSASSPKAPFQLGVHAGGVNVVTAAASGRVVSAGHDGRLLVWDLARPGAPTAVVSGLRSWAFATALLPDGRLVTASGPSGELRVWDVEGPHPAGTAVGRHGGWVFSVIPLTGGGLATVGGNELVLWAPDLSGPARRQLLDRDETWVAAAPLGPERLVVGGAGGRLQQWRLEVEPLSDGKRSSVPVEAGAQ